ncbi:hypothetical protein FQN53_009270 [Emmonsiellopsis sp. PD_33]|nr:hypothetical protein FQN53_009270 [Emmonsiellopsis sp. PD_33]
MAKAKAEGTAAIQQPDSDPIVNGALPQGGTFLKPCPYATSIATVHVGPEDSQREFYVHEGILHQSPSLGSMFAQGYDVSLVDTDPTVFELALRFLYAGDYNNYSSTTVSVYWSHPSSLAWRFEMHSLLYCFAEAHQIQSLSQVASENFQSIKGVSYPDVLEVAKKVYKKLPEDDHKYREKFKDETRAAMNKNRNLSQEPWIVDVFGTESGHLTRDLFTTLNEPPKDENPDGTIESAPEIASINEESQTSDNPQNRDWPEPLTPSPTDEKRRGYWREIASPSPRPESVPDHEADIPPPEPETPTKQPSPTSDWDFWGDHENTKVPTPLEEKVDKEFPAADSHLAMPSSGSTVTTHKPKGKKKGKARKKSACKSKKEFACLVLDPEPQPEQELESELPPPEPEEDSIYFNFNTSNPYHSPRSEEEYPNTNFAHGEKQEKGDLSLVLDEVPPEAPPYHPTSSSPSSAQSPPYLKQAGRYLSKPCSRRASHLGQATHWMSCVKCREDMMGREVEVGEEGEGVDEPLVEPLDEPKD